jgi:hypothetical protein
MIGLFVGLALLVVAWEEDMALFQRRTMLFLEYDDPVRQVMLVFATIGRCLLTLVGPIIGASLWPITCIMYAHKTQFITI